MPKLSSGWIAITGCLVSLPFSLSGGPTGDRIERVVNRQRALQGQEGVGVDERHANGERVYEHAKCEEQCGRSSLILREVSAQQMSVP